MNALFALLLFPLALHAHTPISAMEPAALAEPFLAPVLTGLAPRYPDAATRYRMVKELAAEMERLDGEALYVRRNRARPFHSIVDQLAKEAEAAADWPELLKVFSRLDNAYPNLHASLQPGDWWQSSGQRWQPKARFAPDWLNRHRVEYRIYALDPDFAGAALGDRVVAVNGMSMEEWEKEAFEFCKWPLREQCSFSLPGYLAAAGAPLRYTLVREGRRWEIDVPVQAVPRRYTEYHPCDEDKNIYEGFTLAYAGRFACFFERAGDPSTVLLRIRSFHYGEGSHPIRSVRAEVDALWPWWKERALQTKHLVIDLADNGGGNFPLPYYELLLPRSFQEQYVTYRKLPELLDRNLRDAVFWTEPAQEIWFHNIQREGIWDATPWTEFLPPVPMFCASHERDCREGKFPVREHGFQERVSLVVNPFCVSSCDAFVYTLAEELGSRARIVGQPQAADTAYSRLTINVLEDPSGFRLEVVPIRQESSRQALFSQTIAFTRSVSAGGRVVSGAPVPVDRFVPLLHWQTPQEWRGSAVKAATQ